MRPLAAFLASVFLLIGCTAEKETQGESFVVPENAEVLKNDNKDE